MGSDFFGKQREASWNELPDKFDGITKFKLYATRSNFYLMGWNKSKTIWRVLKIDRSETSELLIVEDSARYSEMECSDLLQRINDGNKSTGGLKFVTKCYGIVGFIRFLGPYSMLLVIKKRKIGMICGHAVYSIAKSRMIPIPYSTKECDKAYSKNENRYKKLLQSVDLTKDFFFSYSYQIMLSLQKNLSDNKSEIGVYETMFVWNEFLTRGIRNQLKNSLWTVALVHGFFKQVKHNVSGRDFFMTLIARRSRHYAGTRYLKRGVNEKGRVANDVETEQIVFEDFSDGSVIQISSVVQNRGSIPLFWSQETSKLNIKPDIILSRKDCNYEATKVHFQNLVKRYGTPIIVFNLIKAREKKPRESILRAEFANAISVINKELTEENHLKFLHWDLSRHSREDSSALEHLVELAARALEFTGIFCCQVLPTSKNEKSINSVDFINSKCDLADHTEKDANTQGPADELVTDVNNCTCNSCNDLAEKDADTQRPVDDFVTNINNCTCNINGDFHIRPSTFQKGVLRTNCIDCLDRTNVSQYAYGLVALGRQLHALGFINAPFVSLGSPLAGHLMKLYEEMGDTLALQYGGSPAHNKIFSEKRGQWSAATQSQEFFRTLQRYYSNAYMDSEKQDAINVFLGHFRPQPLKPALWELDSDHHYNVGRHDSEFFNEKSRVIIKRSFSDGSILHESSSALEDRSLGKKQCSDLASLDKLVCGHVGHSESTPEMSTCDGDISYSRYKPSLSGGIVFQAMHQDFQSDSLSLSEQKEAFDCSNFLNIDLISSSGNSNSCEEDIYERSSLLGSSCADIPCFGNRSELRAKTSSSLHSESPLSLMGKEHSASDVDLGSEQSPKLSELSETFVKWVMHGGTLFP